MEAMTEKPNPTTRLLNNYLQFLQHSQGLGLALVLAVFQHSVPLNHSAMLSHPAPSPLCCLHIP